MYRIRLPPSSLLPPLFDVPEPFLVPHTMAPFPPASPPLGDRGEFFGKSILFCCLAKQVGLFSPLGVKYGDTLVGQKCFLRATFGPVSFPSRFSTA